MNHGKWAILMTCLLILSVGASAFDGQRNGFVVGAGFGPGVISTYRIDSVNESGPGVGANIIIGYALNNRDILTWQLNGNTHNIEAFEHQGEQFYTGPTWFHYCKDDARSPYSAVGVWQYAVWEIGEGYRSIGWAFLVGAGYEFARHLQCGIFWSRAWIRHYPDDHYHGWSSHINILVTALAY
jgi:hypothetical protein